MVGGISKTVCHNGNRMDMGGHRFFSKEKRVMDWWQEILPLQNTQNDPDGKDKVMLIRSRLSRIYFNRKFFDYPIKINVNTIKNMGIVTTIEAGISYLASVIRKKPENSLENFYINRFGKKLYSMFFREYTEKLWGRAPKEISADWGAQRVKGLSIMAILKDLLGMNSAEKKETSLIESFWYPKYGPGQLWETVAERFTESGGILSTNKCVKKIRTQNGQVVGVEYVDENGQEYFEDADILISSMPLKDLIEGMDAPREITSIASGLPYRDFVTIGVLIDKNPDKMKLLPDCWIYVQDPGIKMGRIQIFNNWSPYLVSDPEKEMWIGLEYFCEEGDHYWCMSGEEWMEFAVGELKKMQILDTSEKISDWHCEKVKKAYPAYFDTYDRIGEVISWIDGFPNMYCIGRNGQHRYNNMDHSMMTAFEAVKCIVEQKTDKSSVWEVNVEKEYHEETQKG